MPVDPRLTKLFGAAVRVCEYACSLDHVERAKAIVALRETVNAMSPLTAERAEIPESNWYLTEQDVADEREKFERWILGKYIAARFVDKYGIDHRYQEPTTAAHWEAWLVRAGIEYGMRGRSIVEFLTSRGLHLTPTPTGSDAIDAARWQPIETLPADDALVLAYVPADKRFPQGRIAVWSTKILRHSLQNKTPDHLQFPATHWMPLPEPPDTASAVTPPRGAGEAG